MDYWPQTHINFFLYYLSNNWNRAEKLTELWRFGFKFQLCQLQKSHSTVLALVSLLGKNNGITLDEGFSVDGVGGTVSSPKKRGRLFITPNLRTIAVALHWYCWQRAVCCSPAELSWAYKLRTLWFMSTHKTLLLKHVFSNFKNSLSSVGFLGGCLEIFSNRKVNFSS